MHPGDDQTAGIALEPQSFEDWEHLHMLARIGATKSCPAFGVDFGELSYRTLGRLIKMGLVRKGRSYRYGENRTRAGYWLSLTGNKLVTDGAKGQDETSPSSGMTP